MTLEEFKNDYDWQCAFNEAMAHSYCGYGSVGPIGHVTEIIACDPGENDGADWIAVVKWDDGKYAKMFAGCDYTGWD